MRKEYTNDDVYESLEEEQPTVQPSQVQLEFPKGEILKLKLYEHLQGDI